MSVSLCIDTVDWLGAGCVSIGDTGGGVLAENVATTGDDGDGYLANDVTVPADAGKEICGRITYWPPGLSLYAYEDGGTITSGADGMYVAMYQLYVDYVPTGSETAITYQFGSGSAAAPGATFTATSTLTPGAASATAAGTATGATLTSASTLAAGGATASSTASGSMLTASAALLPGAAIGGGPVSATAPGAAFSAISVLLAGAALAITYARAPAGSGYTPKRNETQSRPAATQESTR